MSGLRRLQLLVAGLVAAVALAAPAAAQAPAATFQVTGDVSTPLTLTTADLGKLPQHKLRVKFLSGSSKERHTYRGPYLYDVVSQAQPDFDPDIKNDKLRFYVAATGADGYAAIVSWGEIDPDFAGRKIMLAISEDGRSLATDGPRLVVPRDKRGGRYVSNVISIRVGDSDAEVDGEQAGP
jgi:DMSO/TMAO reductase YedYZ molybdopterin-dependent catalytic subunit